MNYELRTTNYELILIFVVYLPFFFPQQSPQGNKILKKVFSLLDFKGKIESQFKSQNVINIFRTNMIAKCEFYHGAAIIRLLEDNRCKTVRKDDLGYVVNDEIFVFIKYTTKTRSPWIFTFGKDEIEQLNSRATLFREIIIVLVCGGDGICAITWCNASRLLGNKAGWLSARRKFKEQYAVSGQSGQLHGKVSLSEWPLIVFERISHDRTSK